MSTESETSNAKQAIQAQLPALREKYKEPGTIALFSGDDGSFVAAGEDFEQAAKKAGHTSENLATVTLHEQHPRTVQTRGFSYIVSEL